MKPKFALAIAVSSVIFLVGAATEKQDFSGFRLELFVTDVQKSLGFYRDVLGFTVERQDSDYIALRSGATRIALNRAESLSKEHYFNPQLMKQRRGLGVEIVLETDDVVAHSKRVEQTGYPIVSPLHKRPWGLTDYRITDPDGYYIRITSHE